MSDLIRDNEELGRYIHEEWFEVKDDIRWECIRCGRCCHQNWRINITWYEHDRILSTGKEILPDLHLERDPDSGLTHPFYIIDGKCPYLIENGMVCSLHPDWFYTCATYPFLLMPDGKLLCHRDCMGLGSGDNIDIEGMKEKIIGERKKAGMII